MWQRHLRDEAATGALGAALADALQPAAVIYLEGDLGAGKTTLVRGLLRQLGYQGIVRSPTYTLLESYQAGDWQLAHLDLYRIADAEELEYLGLRDLLDAERVILLEWPARGSGHIPPPDLHIILRHESQGRDVCITATTHCGQAIMERLAVE